MRRRFGDSAVKKPVVAVDASPAARRAVTGTELYAREVASRLPRLAPDIEWVFYSSRAAPDLGVDLTVMPFPRLWSQLRLPVELARAAPDLFFAPSHVVPFWCPAPALTVVHDLAFERFPDAYISGQRRYLRLTTRWAERVCPELLAVSGSTRNDLVQLHRVDPARVTVVYPGGGELPVSTAGAADEELRRLGIDEPFALQVGRVEQRKNPLAALGAVERLPALLLVVAGQVVDDGLAQRLRASPRCRVLGRVQPKVRELLYRRAAALIHPSLYEGFGFPVLEAMRSGLPVVTVRTSSLPEVAGEAALYVDDPTDVPALAEQLRRLLGDSELREKLVEAGRRRAAQFTWDSCARGVLEVIRRRLAAPPAR